MPQWLIEAASGKPRSKPQPPSTAKASTTSVVTTRYGSATLDRELTALKSTEEGGRNDQLNRSAHALAQLSAGGEIDGDAAKSLLRQAAHEIGLEADEIERTLDSAWAAGSRQPRGPISHTMAVAKTPAIINARELSKMAFAPLAYTVPGLLTEGLAILAGRPKFGKSFLCFDIAIAVASGIGKAFGVSVIDAGDVLYCALEDSPRRLAARLKQFRPFGDAPERLQFSTDWPRIGQGCVEALDEWCDQHPDARLIIIDTWRAIKPPTNGRASAYDEDATAAAPLLEFTKRRPGIAVVVVHHVRKSESEDVFDMISGTHGLTGIFDTLMVLARHGDGAKLSAQGRDLEGYEKALARDLRTGGWTVKGDATALAKTGERQELLDFLSRSPGPISLAQLAVGVGKKPDTTRRLLKALINDGAIWQPSHGNYALTLTQSTQLSQFGRDGMSF